MSTATAEVNELLTSNANDVGNASHTQAAQSQLGLRGKITRALNVTIMGAGSGFCPTLCRDILVMPSADRGEIRLCDIDAERLTMMHKVIKQLIRDTGREAGWSVRASTDRRELLGGSTYVICCVEVAGTACVDFENDIPAKYGIHQCIGDTMGPGGLFKGLRSVPEFLNILRDMRELCPGTLMLNYTNPMSMLISAAGRAVPEVPIVGLCHSVQGTSHLLSEYAGVPYEELEWECAGINHLAWFTKLKHKNVDLYTSKLFAQFEKDIAVGIQEADAGNAPFDDMDLKGDDKKNQPYKSKDLVRKDMCVQFGAFITESSGHLSEYLPYYRKNDAGKKLLRRGYDGGTRFYASNWPNWRKHGDSYRAKLVSGEEKISSERSWEYASWIIEAIEKDAPFRIHGNVMNHVTLPGKSNDGEAGKLITNLPGDGAVEVACMIDRNGVHPTRYGKLPAQMAAICASNMAFFDLAATACIEKSMDHAVHALMLDPLTQAVLSPREIRAMANEMYQAEKQYLPGIK